MRGLRAGPALCALCWALGCAAPAVKPASSLAATKNETQPRAGHKHALTWDEYYSEIAERARKRGILVLWFNPPSVEPLSKAEPDALKAEGR